MSKGNHILGKPAFSTNELCRRLGFTVSAALLDELGFSPDERTPTARLWLKSRFPQICYALSQYMFDLQQEFYNEIDEETTSEQQT